MDINDILSAALSRLRIDLDNVRVEIAVAPDAALLYAHGALLGQALVKEFLAGNFSIISLI